MGEVSVSDGSVPYLSSALNVASGFFSDTVIDVRLDEIIALSDLFSTKRAEKIVLAITLNIH